MLQVSLHFATENTATFFNRVGWLDIGYEKLDAFANYKAKLFVAGEGERPTIRIEKYPRWSASVWDLVLRVVAKGLHGDEALPGGLPLGRKGAFIDHLYAKLEHVADGADGRRSHIGSVSVVMKRTRCNYVATVHDDFCGTRQSEVFRHTPAVLNHWELFARGVACALSGIRNGGRTSEAPAVVAGGTRHRRRQGKVRVAQSADRACAVGLPSLAGQEGHRAAAAPLGAARHGA
jgi:hypothetical protein